MTATSEEAERDPMDGLEAIEAVESVVVVESQMSEDAKSGISDFSQLHISSSSTATPSKRRRTGAASSTGTPHKEADDAEEDGEVGLCKGCSRRANISHSIWDTSMLVEWSSREVRTRWCRGCYNTWRLLYQEDVPLRRFGEKVTREPEMRASFRLRLMAHLIFRKKGERPTREQIIELATLLEWVFKCFGIPVLDFDVIPLVEAVENTERPFDIRNVVTMCSKGVESLGVMVPRAVALRQQDLSFAEVPGLLPLRPRVSSTCSGDRAAWNQLDGTKRAEETVTTIVPYTGGSSSAPRPSRQEEKFMSLKEKWRPMLDRFVDADWAAVKESFLTPVVKAFSELLTEVTNFGNKELRDQVNSWAQGFQAGKCFLRAHREWQKAKSLPANMPSMAVALKAFMEFLAATNRKTHVTLRMLHSRVLFEECLLQPEETFETAFELLMDRGLPGLCADVAGTAKQTGVELGSWLRGMVTPAIAEMVETFSPEDLEDVRRLVVPGIAAVARSIQSMPESCVVECDGLLLTLGDMGALLMAGAAQKRSTPASVTAALTRYNTVEMNVITDAVLKSRGNGAWSEVIAEANQYVKKNAGDRIADKRAESARLMTFGDKELPWNAASWKEDTDDNCLVVEHGKRISSGDGVDMLSESLVAMEEALMSWSDAGKAEGMGVVASWCDGTIAALAFMDLSASGTILESVVEPVMEAVEKVHWDAYGQPTPVAADEGLKETFVELEERTEEVLVDEILPDFLEQFQHFVARDMMSQRIQDCSAYSRYIFENVQTREALMQCFRLLCRFGQHALPMQPTAKLIEDWVKAFQLQKHKDTVLSQAMSIRAQASRLEDLRPPRIPDVKHPLMLAEKLEFYSEKVDSRESPTSFSKVDLAKVKTAVSQLSVVQFAGTMVTRVLWEVVEIFIGSCSLNLMQTTRGPPDVDVVSMTEMVTYVVVGFLSEAEMTLSRDTYEARPDIDFKCVALEDLLVSLLDEHQGSVEIPEEAFFAATETPEPTAPWTTWEPKDLKAIIKTYGRLGVVVKCLAFISQEYIGEKKVEIVSNLKVNRALVASMNQLSRNLKDIDVDRCGLPECATVLPLTFGVNLLRQWRNTTKKVVQALKMHIVTLNVKKLEEHAAALMEVKPDFSHYVNNGTYRRALAKKNLLHFPLSDKMNKMTVELCQGLTTCSTLYSSWFGGAMLEEDATLKDNIANLNATFEAGKTASAVITAVRILDNENGIEQKTAVTNLLNKKISLQIPSKLLQELVAVIGSEAYAGIKASMAKDAQTS